jgi:uncharacterized protein (DUF2235 family)
MNNNRKQIEAELARNNIKKEFWHLYKGHRFIELTFTDNGIETNGFNSISHDESKLFKKMLGDDMTGFKLTEEIFAFTTTIEEAKPFAFISGEQAYVPGDKIYFAKSSSDGWYIDQELINFVSNLEDMAKKDSTNIIFLEVLATLSLVKK